MRRHPFLLALCLHHRRYFPRCVLQSVFFVFGCLAGEEESYQILDAFVAAGGNFVDTADTYSLGESEEVIGAWLARKGPAFRSQIILATKCRMPTGLSASFAYLFCFNFLLCLSLSFAADLQLHPLAGSGLFLCFFHSLINVTAFLFSSSRVRRCQ